jgi:hypothetical protein
MMALAARDLAVAGASVEIIPGRMGLGDCVRARFPHPRRDEPGLLILGHMDTVHPSRAASAIIRLTAAASWVGLSHSIHGRREARMSSTGDCVRARFPHPRRDEPGLLILGHMDTVHPVGTLATLPWCPRHREVAGGERHHPVDRRGVVGRALALDPRAQGRLCRHPLHQARRSLLAPRRRSLRGGTMTPSDLNPTSLAIGAKAA